MSNEVPVDLRRESGAGFVTMAAVLRGLRNEKKWRGFLGESGGLGVHAHNCSTQIGKAVFKCILYQLY